MFRRENSIFRCTVLHNNKKQFHDYSSWSLFRTLPSAWPIILIWVKEMRARKYIFQFVVMLIHYSARFHRLIDLRGKLTDRKSEWTHTEHNKRHWHEEQHTPETTLSPTELSLVEYTKNALRNTYFDNMLFQRELKAVLAI